MRVAIVGAGIGGLTLAISLRRHGHDVTVVEKASRFGEVGAGIQISPNGRRVLAALGLDDALSAVAVTPERVVLRRWEDDRELLVNPLHDTAERYGFRSVNVYRPELVDVLVGALAADVDVRLGAVVTEVRSDHRGAAVVLADGTVLDADVVVGADGTHSLVRGAVVGPHAGRFSGYVAYRALVPRERVAHLPLEVTNRLGPDRHLVSYFVGAGARLHNLVCVVPEPTWDVESWTEPGSVEDLRAHFTGWAPAVQEVLAHVEEPVFRWALYDRKPLEYWGDGHVTLLGDACHPMLPFMAQGACQAIEDAAVLTRCLDQAGDLAQVPAALRRYEHARLPRTAEIQSRSWANATTYHLPDGEAQRQRDELYAKVMAAGANGAAMDWLYGHDALTEPLPT